MKHLMFTGTIRELQEYLRTLIDKYGANCTLKEVLENGC